MRKRIISSIVALATAFACLVPAAAFADDALGDVDDPTTRSAAVSSAASSQDEETSATGSATGSVDSAGITVSHENNAATLDGCSFALDDFSRAQVGSNRPIDGVYRGYTYYMGGEGGLVTMVAAGDIVAVYVPAQAALSLDLDISSSEGQQQIRSLIKALDDANSAGGRVVPDSSTWYFTDKKSLNVDGVMFLFDQEITTGAYYACVVGADGSDITDADNPRYLKPSHACFASLVSADDARITAEPSWQQKVYTFFTTLNYSPLWVTLKTTLTAIAIIFVLGLAAAYLCLHVSPRMKNLLDTLFTIPMVLPPTVCGFLLLLLLGSNTALGRFFIEIGFPLIFSWPATVIAAVVVAFPLMYRNALGAFENLDPNMLDAARTLGWSEGKIFFKIMLPLSWSSIAAATVLAFARALGEFGATLFLAGNYLGITRTIPIAIYFEWMNGNNDIAIFWTAVIVVVSFIVILFINLWSQHTTRYRKGAVEHER